MLVGLRTCEIQVSLILWRNIALQCVITASPSSVFLLSVSVSVVSVGSFIRVKDAQDELRMYNGSTSVKNC